MPHYVNDPENPGQHIDAIELVRRNPLAPPPPDARIVDGLLRRDTWTRREAIAILAGANARHAREYFHGVPIPTGYLDGTTELSLQAAGLHHPLHEDILAACSMLVSYSEGQDMAERRAPSEWLAWADSKDFRPYWLDAAGVAGLQPGRLQGDALTPGAIATMRELGCSEAQIEAQRQQAEREQAAGGFFEYVRKAEAARLFSAAVGFHHEPEHMDLTEYDSRAEWLTAHGPSWDKPRRPEWWADALATETAERKGWVGMRGEEMRLVARANNLRTLEAAADDLPLLQWPNEEAWPKGQPLPDKWRNGLFMRKAGLRTWAKEHAPHWLGSALLAESAPESAPAAEAATIARPMQRQRHQEQEILRVLAEKGYTATALAKPPKNNRVGSAKAIVRAELCYPGRVFDKAWERLRANGEIRDA